MTLAVGWGFCDRESGPGNVGNLSLVILCGFWAVIEHFLQAWLLFWPFADKLLLVKSLCYISPSGNKVLGTFSQVLRMSHLHVLADFSGSFVTTTNGKVFSDTDILITANSHSESSVPMPEEWRHWFCAVPVAMDTYSPSAAAQCRVVTAWDKAALCRRCHGGLSVLWPGTQAGGGNCLQSGVERMRRWWAPSVSP